MRLAVDSDSDLEAEKFNSLLSDLGSLHNLNSRPFGSSPVVGKVQVTNNLGEALDDLLHGSADIGPVCKNDIHVRLLQSLQRALESLHNVLPAQSTGVGFLAAGTEENLGAQDVLVAGPVELLEGVAHLDLTGTVGVDLGGVEEVDSVVPCSLHALLDNVAVLGAAVGEPSAEGEDRDLETAGAEVAELLEGTVRDTFGKALRSLDIPCPWGRRSS